MHVLPKTPPHDLFWHHIPLHVSLHHSFCLIHDPLAQLRIDSPEDSYTATPSQLSSSLTSPWKPAEFYGRENTYHKR